MAARISFGKSSYPNEIRYPKCPIKKKKINPVVYAFLNTESKPL